MWPSFHRREGVEICLDLERLILETEDGFKWNQSPVGLQGECMIDGGSDSTSIFNPVRLAINHIDIKKLLSKNLICLNTLLSLFWESHHEASHA